MCVTPIGCAWPSAMVVNGNGRLMAKAFQWGDGEDKR